MLHCIAIRAAVAVALLLLRCILLRGASPLRVQIHAHVCVCESPPVRRSVLARPMLRSCCSRSGVEMASCGRFYCRVEA